MNTRIEFRDELRSRIRDIRFLEVVCQSLRTEGEQDQMRRSMIVMLYANFEGIVGFAFDMYSKAIHLSGVRCCDAEPALSAPALKDVFKALRNPDTAQTYLPSQIRSYKELRSLGIERAFIERIPALGERVVVIPDEYIDTESNVNPEVLRKNLFRLGLPHDLFDLMAGDITRLLTTRNGIAHGAITAGIDETAYSDVRRAALRVMRGMKRIIIDAIEETRFVRRRTVDYDL